jgi:hypothetical protein
MDDRLGCVLAVAGSQLTATLEANEATEDAVRIGAMVKVRSAYLEVVGTVVAIEAESDSSSVRSALPVENASAHARASHDAELSLSGIDAPAELEWFLRLCRARLLH